MLADNWYLAFQGMAAISTAIIAVVIVFTFQLQWGCKLKAIELEDSIKLLLPIYAKFMAGEKGIVIDDYQIDKDVIANAIVKQTDLNPKLVKQLLYELHAEEKI